MDFRTDGIIEKFIPGGAPALLLFADPGCGSCEKALEIVEAASTDARATGLRVLALTQATPRQLAALDSFRKTSLLLGQIDDKVASQDYKVTATPFFYAVNAEGLISDRGTVATKADIRRALRSVKDPREPDVNRNGRVAASSQ
jgi:hypothetical protein